MANTIKHFGDGKIKFFEKIIYDTPQFGSPAFTESYETDEGWGQLVDPTAYPTFGAAALTESYETVEGWL